jgi:hypothetical protein
MEPFDYINDPLTAGQIATLERLLQSEWSEKARDGFLIVSGRFIDETGTDRTEELRRLFHTDFPEGRGSLRRSLEALFDAAGSLVQFEKEFPVYINGPEHGSLGVFPQLPILGISMLETKIYRVFDSRAAVYKSPTGELVRDYIIRTGMLPVMPIPESLLLRKKPPTYWCSFEKYANPTASREALQILEKWRSDCKLRATLPTAALEGLAFVSYSGVTEYPSYLINLSQNPPAFAGYNVEPVASDHPELPGGGLQIAIVGEPPVAVLEQWQDDRDEWFVIWQPKANLTYPNSGIEPKRER